MAAMPMCSASSPISMEERLKLIKQVTETYYSGPERDLKNWPTPTHPQHSPPVKMLIFPDSWFANLYTKHGVSGPYVLGLGAIVFMFSKEIMGFDEHLGQIFGFSGAMYVLFSKLGKKVNIMAELETKDEDQEWWYGPKQRFCENLTKAVEQADRAIKNEDGQKHVFEAFRENVDLQLEAIYRKRQVEVQTAVKKRLDYQLAKENAVRRFQHEHMASWIVDNVVKGITAKQETAAINQCIADLKTIAAQK